MKTIFLRMATILGATFAVSAAAYAGEAVQEQMNIWNLIYKSGGVGYFIIFLSFVGLALVIEHAVTIRREKLLPHYFVVEIEDLFENEQYEEALHLCESEDNLLSRVVGAGLSKIDVGWDAMQESMAEAAEESAIGLNQKISYISLIGAIAPMFGLLGTVQGMVMSFAQIEALGSAATASKLAGGIYIALLTTVEGLLVAIPMMAAYHYFRNKVMRLDLDAGVIAGDLMRRFRPTQKA